MNTLGGALRELGDFGRNYWRSERKLTDVLPALVTQQPDDTTLRYLADNLPTLCWVARGDGYIAWYNRRWHEYCGTSPGEMEGWGWQAVHLPERLPEVMANWSAAIDTGSPFEMTFPLRGADGVFRPFLTRAQPIRDATGQVARWFGVNTDVSDQAAAENALRIERDRSAGMLKSMAEGFVLLDHEFRVLDINAEGLRMEHRPREAFLGKSHWEAWPNSESSEQGLMYQRVMRERTSLSMQLHYTWENGHDAWLDLRAVPHPEGIAIFYCDISDRKRTEIRLRESEAFTRLALDSTTEAFYAVACDGTTTLCNTAFMRALGFDHADQVIGRKLHDVIHHSHPDGSNYPSRQCPIYLAASAGQRSRVKHEVFFRLDGSAFPVDYLAEPIWLDGVLQGAICTFSDITKSLRAERRQQLLFTLADRLRTLSTPREIINQTVELLGRHLQVSRVGFGEVSEDGAAIVYETDYVQGVAPLLGSFSIENFGVQNIAALRRGETTQYSDLSLLPRTADPDWSLSEARAAMAVPLIRHQRLKAILHVSHRDVRSWDDDEITLVEEVAARTWDALERARAENDLRRVAADLSEANRRKTEFLATLAHELRNPLAPIRTGLDLLRLSGDKEESVARVRPMMERQLGHLVHLIDDLLDIARISSGKVELRPEPANLRDIVTAAVEASAPLIESNQHVLHVHLPPAPPVMKVDPVRITQVISNLLTNAAKYTPRGGIITLHAIVNAQQVVLTVTDNGVGIAADSLPHIFDMFNQVGKQIERAQGGLGIGLSLVHQLVRMHGGSVEAASRGLGFGSAFTVRLPLAHADSLQHGARRAGESVHDDAAMIARRIVIADDNQDAAQTLASVLRTFGHTVVVAGDGQEAIEMIHAERPEIAFVDIGMPGLNGYEVARILTQTSSDHPTFLVALTGWGTHQDMANAKRAGFDHHLTKPVDLVAVQTLLRRLPAAPADARAPESP